MNDVPLAFTFSPRWKEELLCSCALGSFVLEMPMGVVSVYLPSEKNWLAAAPEWAKPHWGLLETQLRQWCEQKGIPFHVDETYWTPGN